MARGSIAVDLTGRRFGWLVVGRRATAPGVKNIKWVVLCKCGNEKVVFGTALTSGATISCGCYRKAAAAQRMREMAQSGSSYQRVEAAFDEVFGGKRRRPVQDMVPLLNVEVPEELEAVFAVPIPQGIAREPHRCFDQPEEKPRVDA
jgi:hypothetical protein